MNLLVLCEHDRGVLAGASLEALTFGRDLAAAAGLACEAVVIGEGAETAAADLGAYGAATVHVASHAVLRDFGPLAWGETLVQIIRSTGAEAALACGTDRGNEVLAHVAALLDEPFVANCRQITPGGTWSMTRMQWGGSLLEDATLEAGIRLVTVAHHAVEATPADTPEAGTLVPFAADLDYSAACTVVADRVVLTQGITLATSPVVVGGGRGVGSAEKFAALEELAAELGGVVVHTGQDGQFVRNGHGLLDLRGVVARSRLNHQRLAGAGDARIDLGGERLAEFLRARVRDRAGNVRPSGVE